MIKEDYCSYELSKLLREKGFDTPCSGRYTIRSKDFHLDCTKMCNNRGLFECAAPTHQMAMKWLRKEYNIFIDIRRSLNTFLYGAIIRKDPSCIFNKITEQFETYEKAVESALKYALEKLI